MSEIIDAIRAAVKSMVKPDLLIGKVTKFDSQNWTIDLDLHIGAKVEDVTIKAVLNGEDSGIFVEPKVGSYVLCGMTDGKLENLTALSYSEIENIKFVPSKTIILRNDDFGGLVKSAKVNSEVNEIKQEINKLKTIFNTWVLTVSELSAGAVALKASLGSWSTNLQTTQKADYENNNVKHG